MTGRGVTTSRRSSGKARSIIEKFESNEPGFDPYPKEAKETHVKLGNGALRVDYT